MGSISTLQENVAQTCIDTIVEATQSDIAKKQVVRYHFLNEVASLILGPFATYISSTSFCSLSNHTSVFSGVNFAAST